MRKFLLAILIGIFGMTICATPALAATNVSFSPVNIIANQGETFTLAIGINPQGIKNYTIKMEFHFPADLLEVKSFAFANSSWMPLAQSGYDLIDNTNGVFIKTAGYPGGISSAANFGTVSFFAKKNGNGEISLNSNSFALDAINQNVLANAAVHTTIVLSALVEAPTLAVLNPPVVPPVPAQQTDQIQTTPTLAIPGSVTEAETEGEEEGPEAEIIEEPKVADTFSQPTEQPIPQQPAQNLLLAAVGNILTFGTGSAWLGILIGLIVLAGIIYGVDIFIRKKRKN